MAGRPSNRDERYAQVMQALVRCVARFGLEGASLAQVATEAGLTRPLIRHHLGNRDEMISALQDYVLQNFSEQQEALKSALPREYPSPALVELLFSQSTGSGPDVVLAFAALTARASEDVVLREACRNSILDFEASVADILRQDHPHADDSAIRTTAHGITALYFNVASLAPLKMPLEWTGAARLLAYKLLKELD